MYRQVSVDCALSLSFFLLWRCNVLASRTTMRTLCNRIHASIRWVCVNNTQSQVSSSLLPRVCSDAGRVIMGACLP
ncbi:hypothetical protein BC835DRAFT_1323101 [Cytidiella melzeri]|nr:hypothetical protein BC835DRAFT_1323101 [Cytidiella melzeri]